MENFYDKDEAVFKITNNTRVAHLLGEDIDNPSESFHKVENVCDTRIKLLNQMLFNLKKKGGNNTDEMLSLTNQMNTNFDKIENSLYYRIQNLFSIFETKNEQLNAKNLFLQKHLTKLTKEKMDILIQINICMTKLDKIEEFLGINIEEKRKKKGTIKK